MTKPDEEIVFRNYALDSGLTKREYFAGLAMSKLVMDTGPQQAAKFAVEFADALIAELAKEKS